MNGNGILAGVAPVQGRYGAGGQLDAQSEWERRVIKGVSSATYTFVNHLASNTDLLVQIEAGMESCVIKSCMAGGMGFALGGMFGLFMSSMRYDTPLSYSMNPANPQTGVVGAAAVQDMPWRQQLRIGLKDMGSSAFRSAKSFGQIGMIFSGVECCVEGYRAKNELSNGVASGMITGAILARKSSIGNMAIGAAGFGLFSLAIDYYMRLPSETGGGPIE